MFKNIYISEKEFNKIQDNFLWKKKIIRAKLEWWFIIYFVIFHWLWCPSKALILWAVLIVKSDVSITYPFVAASKSSGWWTIPSF